MHRPTVGYSSSVHRVWSLFLAVTVLFGGAVLLHLGVHSLTAEGESWEVKRRRAVRSLREGAPLLIVYGTAAPKWSDQYRAEAERFAERYHSWGRPAKVIADHNLSSSDRKEAAIILIGRPEANRWVREIVEETLVRFSKGFSFGGRSYQKVEHVLRLLTLSPWNPERPVVLVAGATHESPLSRRGFWFGRLDYSILEGRRAIRYGRLSEGRIDSASDVDILGGARSVGGDSTAVGWRSLGALLPGGELRRIEASGDPRDPRGPARPGGSGIGRPAGAIDPFLSLSDPRDQGPVGRFGGSVPCRFEHANGPRNLLCGAQWPGRSRRSGVALGPFVGSSGRAVSAGRVLADVGRTAVRGGGGSIRLPRVPSRAPAARGDR